MKVYISLMISFFYLQSQVARALRAHREGVRGTVHGERLPHREARAHDREDGEGVHLYRN
jgi:hypothetical protein